jgi:1-acyl-sn-glycerol-3-phosphate acyltransferase
LPPSPFFNTVWRIVARSQTKPANKESVHAQTMFRRPESVPMKYLATPKALLRIILLVLWSLLLVPVQLLVMLFSRGTAAFRITQLWHRGVCAILGLRVEVRGQPVQDGQAVYVSNHVSHFDIPVIGSVLRAAFVAKAEMAKWPVAAFMARLQQTVFISRDSRDGSKVAERIAAEVSAGRSLLLFPEGTTSDGSAVAPFKSTLFAILFPPTPTPWRVQPFTLRVRIANGEVVRTQAQRDAYAYYGDMHAGRHAWTFLRSRGATITLIFHAPIVSSADLDRKSLAALAQGIVAQGLQQPDGSPTGQ